MTILKKIGKFLINDLLFILVFILIFSTTLRQVINKDIINKMVINKISDSTVELIDNNFDKVSNEDLDQMREKIKQNKTVNNIVDKYVDTTINSITSGNTDNVNITDDMKNIIKENKSTLEKEYNITITDEELDQALEDLDNKYDINNYYKKSIKSVSNNLSDEQKQALKLYKVITSIKFIVIISVLVLITTIVIGLYKKSFYKWLKNVSISGITSSVIIGIMFALFAVFINSNIDDINLKILDSILIPIYSLSISLVLLIIYVIIKKKENAT